MIMVAGRVFKLIALLVALSGSLADRPVNPSLVARTITEVQRGGGPRQFLQNKLPFKKQSVKVEQAHHGELMSAPTAIANVLADLCPHGMLPIGTYVRFCF